MSNDKTYYSVSPRFLVRPTMPEPIGPEVKNNDYFLAYGPIRQFQEKEKEWDAHLASLPRIPIADTLPDLPLNKWFGKDEWIVDWRVRTTEGPVKGLSCFNTQAEARRYYNRHQNLNNRADSSISQPFQVAYPVEQARQPSYIKTKEEILKNSVFYDSDYGKYLVLEENALRAMEDYASQFKP